LSRCGGRYLFGRSFFTPQDPAVGASAFADLCRRHLSPPEWLTHPLPAYECPLREFAPGPVNIPKLLRAQLTLGARPRRPPALDREFKTIDFLTLPDLDSLPLLARQRFLAD